MADPQPWLQNATGVIQYMADKANFPQGWNPSGILQWGVPIQYTVNPTWQFNPRFHFFDVIQDAAVAGQILTIELPILANLYDQSFLWFFWLKETTTPGTILRFIASADQSSVNSDPGPNASYDFVCDEQKHLFAVIATSGNYVVKSITLRQTKQIQTGLNGIVDTTASPYYGAYREYFDDPTLCYPWFSPSDGVISDFNVVISQGAVNTGTFDCILNVDGLDIPAGILASVPTGQITAEDTTHKQIVLKGQPVIVKMSYTPGLSPPSNVLNVNFYFNFTPASVEN